MDFIQFYTTGVLVLMVLVVRDSLGDQREETGEDRLGDLCVYLVFGAAFLPIFGRVWGFW